jgi:hypothetical protein
MLRDKSQEIPSTLQPQWLANRGAAAGAAAAADAAGNKQKAPAAAPAAGREGKWAADRWGAPEKEADNKWGHEPFERPRWNEDEGERGLGGGRLPRDTGRCGKCNTCFISYVSCDRFMQQQLLCWLCRWKPGGGEWGAGVGNAAFPPGELLQRVLGCNKRRSSFMYWFWPRMDAGLAEQAATAPCAVATAAVAAQHLHSISSLQANASRDCRRCLSIIIT